MKFSTTNRLATGVLSIMVFMVIQSGSVATAEKDNTPIQAGDPIDLPPKDYWTGMRKSHSSSPTQYLLPRRMQVRLQRSNPVSGRPQLQTRPTPFGPTDSNPKSSRPIGDRPQLRMGPNPFPPIDREPESWPWHWFKKRIKLAPDPTVRI